jgi:hypothetical protein
MENYPNEFVEWCIKFNLSIDDESWESWKAQCIYEDLFDDYTPMDSNDLRELIDPVKDYDCSPPTQYWEEPGYGGMYDCGDDEVPF